jgi:hypothetical protein
MMVTKYSPELGDLTVTEQSADQGHESNEKPETGPSIVPGHSDATSHDVAAKAEAGQSADHDKPAASQAVDDQKPETSRNPSNIMILWPERPDTSSESSFTQDDSFAPKAGARSSSHRRRRIAAMAAVIAVAAVSGAAGGSLATIAVGHMFAAPAEPKVAATNETAVLKDAVARINADVNGVKADLDRVGKTRTAQIGKLGERLDKVERSQEDTTTRIAKIGDAQEKFQDKLRAASAAVAPETTGSIAAANAAKPNIKPDAQKPAIVDGWTLSRVSGGGAIVDGPGGLYEAYPGDPLPGLGRVDAVRYQDGRWVVVTAKGLIVRR